MAKTLNTYAGFTAAELKARSNIPSAANIITGSTSIDCSNITISDVKTVLGESNYNLSQLCTSSGINKYSYFNSGSWNLYSGALEFENSAPYNLGDFAGYNHNAIAPHYLFNTSSIDLYEGSTVDKVINCTINLGEIDWKTRANATGAAGLLTKIAIKTTVDGLSEYENLYTLPADYLQNNIVLTTSIPYTSIDRWSELESEVYFASSISGSKIASIPNINTFETIINYAERAAANGSVYFDSITMNNHSTWIALTTIFIVDQNDDTFYYEWHGIDSNFDDYGDVSQIFTTQEIWAKKSGGNWYDTGETIQSKTNETRFASGNLPFTITYGDLVTLQLREVSTI